MTLEELGRGKYVSLTTFKKDGTPVATPVWAAADGGELFVWTRTDSWKVKRIRNNPRVVLTACDVRGRTVPEAPETAAVARLLDEAGTRRVRKLLARKYTWQFWAVDWPATLARLGRRPHTAIALSPAVNL
ncbi:PPOX class F420-dependent oxidoreductase [Streptomyces sp. 12297]|uniref:PPOX class F420-dependent oxidoreductase n=1 Tax=Streptomyces sp. NBC_00239 TaxID=2903640 RepID=UPI002E27ABB4|nr:PPOX class F420-dependent oxidoreductase [Streptomyces sp. NBC_00239]